MATLTWEERWFPMRGVGGLVDASPWGALSVDLHGDALDVRFCPVQVCTVKLVVCMGGAEVARRKLTAALMQPLREQTALDGRTGAIEVRLGTHLAWRSDDGERRRFDRPLIAPATCD